MAFVTPISVITRRIQTNARSSFRPRRSFQATPKMTLQADLDHIALDCKDVDKMLSFYCDVVQFAPVQVDEFRKGQVPFPSVRVSEATILDFFPNKQQTGLSGAGHFCFNIPKSEFPGLKSRFEQAGLQVADPVSRSGARGTGFSIYITDPENNMVEFRYYEEE
ncbi:Glyoxalase domain-containing protein RDO1 [Gracilariopsis chorda]|uniref:Glyoxalase domain-containing protein RDO1 n=1 Tax=Gracilariopsis chorda TaxID=448386 RepID=A0A2V3IH28_9FLOR|nr:Glyoxalase domain-containing protein RDO1 [Gracilariopsis chorda]|eukprot:PXF41323.1 Glyoxalase domain-containing protein RDO1 [Gracilariopsis chorda]